MWFDYLFSGHFNKQSGSVSFIDLYLIHWPDAQVPGKSNREVRAETWRAMEELYEKGDLITKPILEEGIIMCFGVGKLTVRDIKKLILNYMLIFQWNLGV